MNNIIDNRNNIDMYLWTKDGFEIDSEGIWIDKADLIVYLQGMYNRVDEIMKPLLHKMVLDLGMSPDQVFE